MDKLAYVFPGQGAQYVGMGRAMFAQDAEARALLQEADDALGEKLSQLILEGPEDQLQLTRNTQPAILTVSVAMYRILKRRQEKVDLMAGHSLGEYSALVAAGALQFADAVRAVRARGEFMQQAVPAGLGGMAAVIRLDAARIAEVCKEAAQGQVCVPANYNSPQQTVIAGHLQALDRAQSLLKAAGARQVVRLAVSAPFHCSLMAPVQPRMREVLEKISIAPLNVPVVSNVNAAANADSQRVVDLLVEQVASPVRWVESVQAMKAAGVSRVVEVGPGKALNGLIRQIDKTLQVSATDEDS